MGNKDSAEQNSATKKSQPPPPPPQQQKQSNTSNEKMPLNKPVVSLNQLEDEVHRSRQDAKNFTSSGSQINHAPSLPIHYLRKDNAGDKQRMSLCFVLLGGENSGRSSLVRCLLSANHNNSGDDENEENEIQQHPTAATAMSGGQNNNNNKNNRPKFGAGVTAHHVRFQPTSKQDQEGAICDFTLFDVTEKDTRSDHQEEGKNCSNKKRVVRKESNSNHPSKKQEPALSKKGKMNALALADYALLCVSAAKGEFEATVSIGGAFREDALLAFTLGIKTIIVVVTKMDLVDYKKERFEEIKNELSNFLKKVGFNVNDDKAVKFVPVSAKSKKQHNNNNKHGEGVLYKSTETRFSSWYGFDSKQTTLVEAMMRLSLPSMPLDTVKYFPRFVVFKCFRIPAFSSSQQQQQQREGEEHNNKEEGEIGVIVGKVVSSSFRKGDTIVFTSNKYSKIHKIQWHGIEIEEAPCGSFVSFQVDISILQNYRRLLRQTNNIASSSSGGGGFGESVQEGDEKKEQEQGGGGAGTKRNKKRNPNSKLRNEFAIRQGDVAGVIASERSSITRENESIRTDEKNAPKSCISVKGQVIFLSNAAGVSTSSKGSGARVNNRVLWCGKGTQCREVRLSHVFETIDRRSGKSLAKYDQQQQGGVRLKVGDAAFCTFLFEDKKPEHEQRSKSLESDLQLDKFSAAHFNPTLVRKEARRELQYQKVNRGLKMPPHLRNPQLVALSSSDSAFGHHRDHSVYVNSFSQEPPFGRFALLSMDGKVCFAVGVVKEVTVSSTRIARWLARKKVFQMREHGQGRMCKDGLLIWNVLQHVILFLNPETTSVAPAPTQKRDENELSNFPSSPTKEVNVRELDAEEFEALLKKKKVNAKIIAFLKENDVTGAEFASSSNWVEENVPQGTIQGVLPSAYKYLTQVHGELCGFSSFLLGVTAEEKKDSVSKKK